MKWGWLACVVVGCSGSGELKEGTAADAKEACETLTKQGFGSGCREDKPGGLGAAAWENYVFDIPEPKDKTCQILTFKKNGEFDSTVKAFEGASALAGPHRYGNAKKRIFVQCNEGMPRDVGEKLEKAVSQL